MTKLYNLLRILVTVFTKQELTFAPTVTTSMSFFKVAKKSPTNVVLSQNFNIDQTTDIYFSKTTFQNHLKNYGHFFLI